MNIQNTGKTNLGLNLVTMIVLLIVLVAGAFIAADMYSIVQRVEKQSNANGDAVNQTLSKLVDLQQASNIQGNNSIVIFKALIKEINNSSNQTLANQENFFKPYFNQSFSKIFKALNITN